MNLSSERSYPTPLANSPLLPLLLLSLARQRHCPRTATAIASQYDYIVVGGGTAGSVMASRLSEMTCFSVLLLEAGDVPPVLSDVPVLASYFLGTKLDWGYKTVPQQHAGKRLKNREFAWHSGKGLGGSTLMSGGMAYRGNRQDYDSWAVAGAKGWSYKDVLPYFFKLEDYRAREYLANGYHAVGGPGTIEDFAPEPPIVSALFEAGKFLGYEITDPDGPKQIGFHRMTPLTRGGQMCSSAKSYLVPADNRKNLDIVVNAVVTKILINKGRATGVQFDHDGSVFRVRARKEVIVSAGAVETPKLLMLSGIGPRKELEKFKIPVLADLPVGLNLQDHIAVAVIVEVNDEAHMPSIEAQLDDQSNIMEYIQSRTGILSYPFGDFTAGFVQKKCSPVNGVPDYQISVGEIPRESMEAWFGVSQEIEGPRQNDSVYSCYAALMHPKSRGIISLRSTNPYDDPIIDPRYYQDPQDLADIVEGVKACLELLRSPPMKRLGFLEPRLIYTGCESFLDEADYLRCAAKTMALSFFHYAGTSKMGDPQDPSTVVDQQLRVKNIRGLRVVDASVMPALPSANTQIPTIMVAEKAADMVKDTVTCSEVIHGQEGYPVF